MTRIGCSASCLWRTKVADEIVSEEAEVLDKLMPRMFEVMQKKSRNSHATMLKRGHSVGGPPFWILQILMMTLRAGDALIHSKDKEMIEEMDGELAKVIEDFLRAVDVEAL